MFVISDAAQSFGGTHNGRKVGSFGDVATTSFFPAKPLGCYGDGGAIFTNDGGCAEILRSIRFHGKGSSQYDNVRTGITGRLDTIQAAVLRCKLRILDEEINQRQKVAERYTAGLADCLTTPLIPKTDQSAWAQYTLRANNRDQIRAALEREHIPSAVYYARPLHQQPAFSDCDGAGVSMPVSEMLAEEVFSLPMHPYLSEEDQEQIIQCIKQAS